MQKKNACILFFLVSIVAFYSCKKDVDSQSPVITFNTPVYNQFFNVNDIVHVTGSISDETKITQVSVSLVDAQQNPAYISIAVPVTSPSMNIDMYYTLDNIHLESGTYYILITASDGKNDSKRIQKITIAAVPKVVKQVLVASFSTSSQTNLSSVDSSFGSMIPLHSFTGDFIGLSASSYYQRAYLCGGYTGHFTGIKLDDNAIAFDVSPVTSLTPYFTGFLGNDKNNYVARYDETVRGYDYTGSIFYTAMAVSGHYVQHCIFNSGYLVAEEQQKFSTSKILATYFPTGAGEQQTPLTQNVVALCEQDANNVFVFGNTSGQGVIQLFDRINNNLWNPYPFSLATGSILCIAKIDGNTYLIGHSNGIIYKYEYSINSVTTYLTGYTAVKLIYDDLNNEVYVAEANRISTFNYTTATIHHSVISADSILDMHIVYNR